MENEALEQANALNKITLEMLKQQRENNKRIFVALIISILVNLCIVGGFLWYESQWEYTTTTESTITQNDTVTQEVDGENAEINNVKGNQYKDNAVHNEGVNDGESETNNSN